jgi:hypothetical protein
MRDMPEFLVHNKLSPDILTGRLYFPTPTTPVPPCFLSCPSVRIYDDHPYPSGKRVIEFVALDPDLYFTLAIYCPNPDYKFHTIRVIKRFFDTYGYGCRNLM